MATGLPLRKFIASPPSILPHSRHHLLFIENQPSENQSVTPEETGAPALERLERKERVSEREEESSGKCKSKEKLTKKRESGRESYGPIKRNEKREREAQR